MRLLHAFHSTKPEGMSSLKRRLSEDEALLSSLQEEVKALKKFKVGDRTITMTEAPARPPGRYSPRMQNGGFPFVAPQTTSPRVNVNVNPPSRPWVDPREGERQAFLSGYKLSYPRVNQYARTNIAVAPMQPYKRSSAAMKKTAAMNAAKAASKASLKRARTSAKRGGTSIPKKTLLKAGKKADARLAMRMWMKKSKARLIKALSSRPKIVLAKCLSYS